MRRVLLGVVVGLLLVPASASAHEVTCSKSRLSHWKDIRALKAVKVDDLPGAVCIDIGKDRIKLVGQWRGLVWRQRIVRQGARPSTPWFCWNIDWWVERPYPSRLG